MGGGECSANIANIGFATKKYPMPRLAIVVVSIVFAVIAIFPAIRTLLAGDDLSFMYPNSLLYFSDFKTRMQLRAVWQQYNKINTKVKYEPSRIPQISAEDYSWEVLRDATENFQRPALVKGLFLDTEAVRKWGTDGYLAGKIGPHTIPVVRNAVFGTTQRNRTDVPFPEAVKAIIDDVTNQDYLFFPQLSREMNVGVNQELLDAVTNTVMEDLELSKRIWNGFGTAYHKNFFGSQMIIGNGREDTAETTGTGWHCAIATNYFIQVFCLHFFWFLYELYSLILFMYSTDNWKEALVLR